MHFVRGCIIGSGSSSSTPSLHCVLSGSPCVTCAEALQNPLSRQHRLNPSFLLQLRHPEDNTIHNVLVDCGKTFRESAIKVFPLLGVKDISAVLLTHNHADATFGIDDLREFNREDTHIDIFLDDDTRAAMQRMYAYLFPKNDPPKLGELRKNRTLCIASLQWVKFESLQRLDINIRSRVSSAHGSTERADDIATFVNASFSLVPIAVPHGADCNANAFLIPMHRTGEEPRLLLYVSDVSKVEEKLLHDVSRAKTLLGAAANTRLEVLILDMLSHKEYHSHLNVNASIDAAKRIDASKTFFIGMSHSLNYIVLTKQLEEMGLADRMFFGFDGCVVAEAHSSSEGKPL